MKKLTTIFLVLLLLFGGATPASANSAQSYWEGVDRAGVVINDGDCPIVVEHELLTFDLQEFPQNHYRDEEEFLAYTGKVTAQYTFYNPSEMTVTAKLLFPFGEEPWYSFPSDVDARKYDILVDGKAVEKNIRHTLSYSGQFDLAKDLPLVSDSFLDDPFYSPELTVTVYKFSVSNVDTHIHPSAIVGFDVPKGLGDQRFYLPEQCGALRQDNGDMRIFTSAKYSGNSFSLYVFGEPLETMPIWTAYHDGGATDDEIISGSAIHTSTETMTFQAFALSGWSADTGISETDWYNATVTDLNLSAEKEHPITYRSNPSFNKSFMRWYEYEIIVAPGQRIVNTVTAPIYPSINLDYEPDIYGYTYLLSPAKTWKSFGKLEVVVNTPYYITESSLGGVEKTETGYKASFDGLPEGEFAFTMSTSENPQNPKSGFWYNLRFFVTLFVVYIGIVIRDFFISIGDFFRNLL